LCVQLFDKLDFPSIELQIKLMSQFNEPLIIGIGGTTREGSSSEKALRIALESAKAMGAKTHLFSGEALDIPMYAPHLKHRSEKAIHLVEQLSLCDGLIISSPAYHGSISGLVKNALDYVEDLRQGERVYLDDVPLGLIGCGAGWQGATQALTHLRSIAHALRAWPTPMGAALNTSLPLFDDRGECIDASALSQLQLVGRQVVQFVYAKAKRVDEMTS
jgi:FMN reductase